MTAAECQAQLRRLMVLRNPPTDIGPYVELLSAASADELARGVTHALKNRTFFPVPAELFADCEQVRPRDTWRSSIHQPEDGDTFTHHIPNPFGGKGITVTVHRNWKYDCADCGDSGWFEMWCGEGESALMHRPCGRRYEHAPHAWVQPCACWRSNPTVMARRQRLADGWVGDISRDTVPS